MAIRVRHNANLNGLQARQAFDEAMRYLKRSALAADIIADLESINDLLTVYVGKDPNPKKSNVYGHPPEGEVGSAGTIYWDPAVTVGVKDKAMNRKGERVRPDVAWVGKAGLWSCCGRIFGTERDVLGAISAPVCLVHEMGHAMQFLSDKAEYRRIKKSGGARVDLEQINTQAIEQPIILELRAIGAAEGIRWHYLDTV